jgi:hypothetical protein
MKPVLIVENSTNSLKLNESTSSTSNEKYLLSGIFTEFGVKNRNDRVYTAEKFLPALEELTERIQTLGVVYGEFDHPDVFDTSLSRSSHTIQSTKYVSEKNRVEGEIRLLSTYWGKEAKSLVNDGCPIFVSSRAAGVTESDGSVALKKLFTYDIVADPGFGSAKMHVKPLNESLGYKADSNFRIYEMSDESKINELFNMNQNDFVTKTQLSDYSRYLITELASTKKEVKSALTKGNLTPKKLEQLLEYYEELNNTNGKMVKYLDYLAEKVQIVVNENKKLTEKTDRIIEHNDYLAESLEKSINYSEYLAENLDKNIDYAEYIAENLDKSISYGEYLAENLDKSISYGEYLAENLDKNIAYSEYIAENLDKNIAYSEYIAENLDKSISYGEYLAENLDNSIAYSEYLSEHVEGNIAYSEYIAENLDDNIAYAEYVAESVDKSIDYQRMIVEKLNEGALNESVEGGETKNMFPTPEQAGFVAIEEEEESVGDEDQYPTSEETPGKEGCEACKCEPCECATDEEEEVTKVNDIKTSEEEEVTSEDDETEEEEESFEISGDSDTELSKSIDKLIGEAKKRKASETTDLHFLKFLNKSQVDSFYDLTNEEQDTVKLYINENSSFYTSSDVLKLISEALSTKNETLEDRVIRLMPENIKPIWNQLNESSRKSVLSQARLYPEEVLKTESQLEHFWMTRNLKTNESVTKKLVSHEALIQEDRLSENEVSSIMERFKSL